MIKSKPHLLQIALLGNPILRRKTQTIPKISDPTVQNLIDSLIATVKEVDGAGIAAPQVYQSLRLFILASHPSPRYPKAPKMLPTAIINPKIISLSKATEKDWEGCLSIPGIRALVSRSKEIKVEYATRRGLIKKQNLKGFIARVFQHEFDHLNGMVFLDRVENNGEIVTEKEYQRLMKKTSKVKASR